MAMLLSIKEKIISVIDTINAATGLTDSTLISAVNSLDQRHRDTESTVKPIVKVAFCDWDGTELYSRLICSGDDCPDPITTGNIKIPTRPSDVQYHYTYSGWSASLEGVTDNLAVTATYATELVKYTVRFYDGDTLMQESQVAYGGTATPPDTKKEGYSFTHWTINGVAASDFVITQDTDIYGVWNLFEGYLISAVTLPKDLDIATKYECAYSPDGKYFAVSSNNTIYVLNTSDWSIAFSKSVYRAGQMCFSHGSEYFACSYLSGTRGNYTYISCYNTTTWKEYLNIYTYSNGKPYQALAFLPDDSRLYFTTHNNTTLDYIDMDTKECIKGIYSGESIGAPFMVCAGSILFMGNNHQYKCFKVDGTTLTDISLPDMPTSNIYSYGVDNAGKRIFVRTFNNTVARIYNIAEDLSVTYEDVSMHIPAVITYDGLYDAAFAPNSNVLAAPSYKGLSLINLDKTPSEPYYDPDLPILTDVFACAYSPDGLKFVVVGNKAADTSRKGIYIYDTVRT